MGNLVFGGLDFSEYGIVVDGIKQWEKPERDTTSIHVPGRSGDLIIDNGCWKNIIIVFTCAILNGWERKFQDFCKYLYQLQGGYQLLFYDAADGSSIGGRMAEFRGGISPEFYFKSETGLFDLEFNCKPFLYVGNDTEEEDFSSEDVTMTFDNTYGMKAFPLIRIYNAPNGARCYFSGGDFNSWTISVAANPYDIIEIDCELETCIAYNEFDEQHAVNALSFVTVDAGDGASTPFPFFSTAMGMDVVFLHEYWEDAPDPTDPPILVATYTGTASVYARFTRI